MDQEHSEPQLMRRVGGGGGGALAGLADAVPGALRRQCHPAVVQVMRNYRP